MILFLSKAEYKLFVQFTFCAILNPLEILKLEESTHTKFKTKKFLYFLSFLPFLAEKNQNFTDPFRLKLNFFPSPFYLAMSHNLKTLIKNFWKNVNTLRLELNDI